MLLQDRQIDRTVLKVQRIAQAYEEMLVKGVVYPEVYLHKDGKLIKATSGCKWGKDFTCSTFSFTVKGIEEGEKYYLYADGIGIYFSFYRKIDL